MANIYAFSVDYDGCLADQGMINPKTGALLGKIYVSLIKDPDARAVLMVGSYRQSMWSDAYCLRINQNGSCFPVYENILAEFKEVYPQLAHRISLDKFLLADIHEKKPSGAHFESAVQQHTVNPRKYYEVEVFPEPIWHDQKKCGLQYVQMHHLATQFCNDTIIYCFHDNCDERILRPSNQFFNKFDSCIPSNVTLQHFCYVLGYYRKQFQPIQGLGDIDFDFRKNILHFEGVLHAPIPQTKLYQSIQKEHDEYLLHLAANQNKAACYLNTHLKIKNETVHCTKKFFANLIETVVKNQQISLMADKLRQLHAHTVILPGDHFEEPALQALCFLVDEFFNKKCELIDELLLVILMLTPEIKEKMQLKQLTQGQIIESYYQRYLGYQAVMMGKIKEELNDLCAITNYIMSRFSCSEAEITAYLKKQHSDVPWLPLQASILKTPKQIILKAIRKQSVKNEGNKRIQAAFFLLQCMVAQAIMPSLIAGIFDSWKRTRIDVSSRESVCDLLMRADDNAGCGCFSFFSTGNMGFLNQLPKTIEVVSRYC